MAPIPPKIRLPMGCLLAKWWSQQGEDLLPTGLPCLVFKFLVSSLKPTAKIKICWFADANLDEGADTNVDVDVVYHAEYIDDQSVGKLGHS